MSGKGTQKSLPPETPLLPRRAREERPLFIIMTVMAFLAGLTLLIFLIGLRASQSWQSDLSRTLTVQILHDGSVSTEDLSERAVISIKQIMPGSRISVMKERESRALLSPWIGDLELPEDIALPVILKVDRGSDVPVNLDAIQAALGSAGLTADVDDHTRWSRNIQRTWQAVKIGMMSIILIVLAGSAAVAAYATHSVLRVRQTVIDVLAHVGAPDRFIAGLFIKRFFGLGLAAAAAGGITAFLCLIVFASVTKPYAVDILPVTGLRLPDFVALGVLVLAMGLISAGTAGWATLAKLRRDRRAT